MNVLDLRELIQDDIITCMDGHFDCQKNIAYSLSSLSLGDYVEEVKTQLCQIVVDRINEYEKGK